MSAIKTFTSKYRRLILFLADSSLYWFSAGMIYLIACLDKTVPESIPIRYSFLLLYLCIILASSVLHIYDSLWRYATSGEYLRLILAAADGYLLFALIAIIFEHIVLAAILTFSITCAYIMLAVLLRLCYRIYRSNMVKKTQHSLVQNGAERYNVVIIGAGDGGAQLLRDFHNDKYSVYSVLAFFDDDKYKHGRSIGGVKVLGPIDQIKQFTKDNHIDQIILAIPSLSAARRSEILSNLSDLSCEIKILPDTAVTLAKGSNVASAVRPVNIEDLLGRNKIEIFNPEIQGMLNGKTVLVTGGGGSIGSELCRQIASLGPQTLVIFDIAENTSYLLKGELERKYNNPAMAQGDYSAAQIRVEIGSIRDNARVEELFKKYRPQVVFHAAAHKHVPLMEWSPGEAVKNNIFGSWNVYTMADKYGAEKLVQISTDKAINPTNIMGASKRYCEFMVSAMAQKSKQTVFSAVRFGNVLGSAGSVIPIFTEQINAGGPVTVTHKEITRYFMTIPEAVSLVLKAASIAKNGELMVLDMGNPVKILSLAEKMITLSGLKPYEDIDIIETGLRPGEKLYEELLVDYDSCSKTDDSKIFIENERNLKTTENIESDFVLLQKAVDSRDSDEIFRTMHALVPTYKISQEVNK